MPCVTKYVHLEPSAGLGDVEPADGFTLFQHAGNPGAFIPEEEGSGVLSKLMGYVENIGSGLRRIFEELSPKDRT
jgi:hypothetical protein